MVVWVWGVGVWLVLFVFSSVPYLFKDLFTDS